MSRRVSRVSGSLQVTEFCHEYPALSKYAAMNSSYDDTLHHAKPCYFIAYVIVNKWLLYGHVSVFVCSDAYRHVVSTMNLSSGVLF